MNEVEAVKDVAAIKAVGALLNKHYGALYSDVWNLGLQAALRISDLLGIKYSDIKNGCINLKESKTGKPRIIELNSKALAIVEQRRSSHPNDVYLFEVCCNRARRKPISRQSIAAAFKEVGLITGLQLGTHSMRKTRGFHLYKQTNNLALVQRLLNHRSSAETLRYIGLNDSDVSSSYHDLVL